MGFMTFVLEYPKRALGRQRYLHLRARLLDLPIAPGRTMRACRQFMRLDPIRATVLTLRYFFLAKILRRLRTFQSPSESVSPNTIDYNLTAFKRPLLLQRTRVLLRPLTVIETLTPKSRILIVG